MSKTNFAAAQLRSFIDRILRLKSDGEKSKSDIRAVYAEAAAQGIDKTRLGILVAERRQIEAGYKVYFALFEGRKLLKIGVSRNVQNRLRELEAETACGATLLHSCPGAFRDESAAHVCFNEYRSHGEWFHWNQTCAERVAIAKSDGILGLLRTVLHGGGTDPTHQDLAGPAPSEVVRSALSESVITHMKWGDGEQLQTNPAPVASQSGSGAADGEAIAPPSAASISAGDFPGEGGHSPPKPETDDARAAPAAEQSVNKTAQSSDPANSIETEPEDIGAIPAFMDRRKQQEARM